MVSWEPRVSKQQFTPSRPLGLHQLLPLSPLDGLGIAGSGPMNVCHVFSLPTAKRRQLGYPIYLPEMGNAEITVMFSQLSQEEPTLVNGLNPGVSIVRIV